MVTKDSHNGYKDRLESRAQTSLLVHKQLLDQNIAPVDDTGTLNVKAGKNALVEYLKSMVYLKRSGKKYNQLCRDIVNSYVAKSREYPQDLSKANS